MSQLALMGGDRTITKPFSRYNTIGPEESSTVQEVLKSGVLSRFLGCWDPDFFGGEQVQALEVEWAAYFSVGYAVTVNSNTSGLIAAVGAIGIEPGDEVIVSPWTMSASATSILIWNGIPVFADIEGETFNLDPLSIERNITPRTRAIMLPDIFGHAADLDAIMDLAEKHSLKVIEDAAQVPGAVYRGRYAGTIGHIGVYSLNYHKHVHTGEGGVCVTNDPVLAERLQLIRNHAEAVVEDKGVTDLTNMIGFNFRMTEIEAAIGREQLKKLPALVGQRIAAADRLTAGIRDLKGIRVPVVKAGCTHVYYVYPLVYSERETGIPRKTILAALQAEGVPIGGGYQNLHLQPLYQKRVAYGKGGFPWTAEFYKGNVSYGKGICPVAEALQDNSFISIGLCSYTFTDQEVDSVVRAFRKVWDHLDELRNV
ncbi:MAG: DegT/DnrJ/EryC1/StrS family aminotransferase [Syntrophaceae bacterium]|nr:DegT/DnrJ/EryC1/StrS family aminotransferase [Syntrophaceae bacterium]